MKYCRKCKKEHSENNEFCPKCGSKLVKFVEEKERQKEHKTPKQISFKKLLLIIIPIAFIVVIIVGIASFYSINSKTAGAKTTSPTDTGMNFPPERISGIIKEYNDYINLSNSDSKKMTTLYNRWVDVINNAVKDNQLTSGEVSLMKNAIENYASEYNVVKQHLSNFRNFIVSNENDLKIYTTVDTFQMKTEIDDAMIGMENNVNYMKTKTQDLINAYQAQQEQLMNIMKILIGLA